MKNNLGNLIEVLTQIKEIYGENIPISINLYHDRVLALQSICYDDTEDTCPQILFEADLEDRVEQRTEFTVYSQREVMETLLTNKKTPEELCGFLYDLDKIYDLLILSKREFLDSYIYLSEAEYDLTLSEIQPINDSVEENEDQLSNLANLCRRAENLYIEELNDRPTEWNVLGSQLKEAIYDFARNNFTEEQQEYFNEYCDDLAI